jgi:hypothetical protein
MEQWLRLNRNVYWTISEEKKQFSALLLLLQAVTVLNADI